MAAHPRFFVSAPLRTLTVLTLEIGGVSRRGARPDADLPPAATLYELSSAPEAELGGGGGGYGRGQAAAPPSASMWRQTEPALTTRSYAIRNRTHKRPSSFSPPHPTPHHDFSRVTRVHRTAALPLDGDAQPWVTVFGFPPSTATMVLRDFQAIGDVIQYQLGDGTPEDVLRALARVTRYSANPSDALTSPV